MAVKNFTWFLVSRNISPITDKTKKYSLIDKQNQRKYIAFQLKVQIFLILAVGAAVLLLFWYSMKWLVEVIVLYTDSFDKKVHTYQGVN